MPNFDRESIKWLSHIICVILL